MDGWMDRCRVHKWQNLCQQLDVGWMDGWMGGWVGGSSVAHVNRQWSYLFELIVWRSARMSNLHSVCVKNPTPLTSHRRERRCHRQSDAPLPNDGRSWVDPSSRPLCTLLPHDGSGVSGSWLSSCGDWLTGFSSTSVFGNCNGSEDSSSSCSTLRRAHTPPILDPPQ